MARHAGLPYCPSRTSAEIPDRHHRQRRELIATAAVPGAPEELRLYRRGGDFMILLDRVELMSTRMSGSEEALAMMTCARLHDRPRPHLLIGGYGMGFTLRAALAALPESARITIVELVPQIIG